MSSMPGRTYRISVLADGNFLLNGEPAAQADLVAALDSAPPDSVVWYFRENPAADAPSHALEVLKIITGRRLAVRLFTKPDFSDTEPTQVAGDPARVFDSARKRAALSQLIFVRPDCRLLGFPAVPRSSVAQQALDEVERILSSATRRNVAILAGTAWTMAEKPTLQSAASDIPFMGLLIGLTCVGHTVWVFDWPGSAAFASACSDADLMIVDETRLALMPEDWNSTARSAMRNGKIFLYRREGRQLVPATSSGTRHGATE
jgi:hypothetical protein